MSWLKEAGLLAFTRFPVLREMAKLVKVGVVPDYRMSQRIMLIQSVIMWLKPSLVLTVKATKLFLAI